MVLAAFCALPATPASAHPLDEVLQQVYLTPAATTLDMQIDIVAGTLVAPGFARSLDTDGDRRLSASETSAHDVRVRTALAVATDDVPADVTITSSTYPEYDLLAAGGGTITVRATAPLPTTSGAFAVTDGYIADQKTRIQLSVLVAKDAGRAAGSIRRGHEGRAIAVGLTPAAAAADTDAGKPSEGTGTAMFAALKKPVGSPWALALLIAVCALLGALHALTPGHGKAMLAAYLVGSRGTPRQAIALGGVVTVTHTGSVLLLGAAVLAAGHYVMPALLVPALKVITGVVVLFLGLRILRRRLRGESLGHSHAHSHPHDRFEEDDRWESDEDDHWDEEDAFERDRAHWHAAGRDFDRDLEPVGAHSGEYEEFRSPVRVAERTEVVHAYPMKERTEVSTGTRREIAAMGAAGGLIPCPEALGVLILAVGLNRTALGLAMIVAFSAGLGAVLIGLGLILVTARERFTDVRPGPLLRRLPVISAALVVILGAVMTVSGTLAVL
ncbi:ABC-type nickel/cobalt efflux system permease component RcnA [Actinoplanes lutulentus]|uniref:hypothetical protein n=1 Tax=Actinoplanes lutulentus TaxID=1287878 RepID=UPI0011B93D97|nr:hypothetical protein [Actinoplanes lutulentus]MBB2948387.1 ABC-type nickel/cobalt efflux system permease component RcnA [Actinoplanes lutulentus]